MKISPLAWPIFPSPSHFFPPPEQFFPPPERRVGAPVFSTEKEYRLNVLQPHTLVTQQCSSTQPFFCERRQRQVVCDARHARIAQNIASSSSLLCAAVAQCWLTWLCCAHVASSCSCQSQCKTNSELTSLIAWTYANSEYSREIAIFSKSSLAESVRLCNSPQKPVSRKSSSALKIASLILGRVDHTEKNGKQWRPAAGMTLACFFGPKFCSGSAILGRPRKYKLAQEQKQLQFQCHREHASFMASSLRFPKVTQILDARVQRPLKHESTSPHDRSSVDTQLPTMQLTLLHLPTFLSQSGLNPLIKKQPVSSLRHLSQTKWCWWHRHFPFQHLPVGIDRG